ncbi:putative cyclin-dependent kinase F-2 [Brachypodium distachyon]|uniref:[RNA-polymerase]-subunit kinase n=1 Tax=Brachypodium distachyon TaxID=15368 RepID=I1ICC6_BRADI|nr:putative cyclin-dependent kinase F-2 [Brachypodium distachyon]PNT69192.1 hypothetical protein BRADI_3g50960v3 [Brachypodium distachyon]|eukprot:XP_003572786.1 putative cyclin-dependent kinase F-2 [Brachypodium distachyon]
MAVRKRPAAVLSGQAQAAERPEPEAKKTRFAKRTSRGTITKPTYGSLDEYKQTSILGQGTYGVVFEGRHKATGETVAIKFLLPPDDDDDDDTKEPAPPVDPRELLQEARFLEACVGNPHVVGFRCLVRDPANGELGLVMEHVGRQSLLDFLHERRSPLPEATVRAFMRQLLTGAKGMHDRGVIHRDIKPGNILIAQHDGGEQDQDQEAVVLKICDFGLALSASQWPPHNQVGTMLYRAPEMLMGKLDYDAVADTWSLGCVMAELVAGEILLRREVESCPRGQYFEDVAYLRSIFRLLGMPDDATWPGFSSLPLANVMTQLQLEKHGRLRELFPPEMLSNEGFEVLNGLLTCNPDERLTAEAALELPWFASSSSAAANV